MPTSTSWCQRHYPRAGDRPNDIGRGGKDDERSLTPEFRAIDGFDFYGDDSKAIAGGVTTVQIAPGSDRLMPGKGLW